MKYLTQFNATSVRFALTLTESRALSAQTIRSGEKEDYAMAREDFTCSHSLRVRWSEVDMQKIVFNGNYLNYFDVAVAE